MANTTYLIGYTVTNASGQVIKDGEMRCKNKRNEFEAKAGLGKHLEQKYPNCNIVMHYCKDETLNKAMESLYDLFGNFPKFGTKK